MDSIIVRVSELYAQVELMKADGMDYVELSLNEADTSDPNDPIPAFLFLEAGKFGDPEGVIYDDIDALPEDKLNS